MIVETATAGIAVLTALGGAAKFVWNRVDAKITALEAETKACLERERASLVRGAAQITIIELLWMEVKRIDPGSETLKRAHKLLEDLKREQEEARERING